jgi:ferredoxin-NADP reductase
MITAEKRFGSYVLRKVRYDEDEGQRQRPDLPEDAPSSSSSSSLGCAIASQWTPLTLMSVDMYNHDVGIFRFQLPEGCDRLDLPVGATLLVRAPGRDHDGSDAVRPYTSISDNSVAVGYFDLLCKRYDQWGVQESPSTHFLYTKTNHSYKPAGAVSNYIHSLRPGDKLEFKHNHICKPRFEYPFKNTRELNLIAVGVGVAPMISLIREIIRRNIDLDKSSRTKGGSPRGASEEKKPPSKHEPDCKCSEMKRDDSKDCGVDLGDVLLEAKVDDWVTDLPCRVVLLYGVRTVKDILMRAQLDVWSERHPEYFEVVYCVGSRWANVHMGAKTGNHAPPPLPEGFAELRQQRSLQGGQRTHSKSGGLDAGGHTGYTGCCAELGWVNEEKIRKHAFPPRHDGSVRVMVCGLPGVYEKICGPRHDPRVAEGSILHTLGYTDDMVVKL